VKESAHCWDPDPEIEALFYGDDAAPAKRRVAERKRHK
jgi:hypothetical protein